MSSVKRAGLIGVCGAIAITVAQTASATSTQKAKTITTTQRLVIMSASGPKLTIVGTSDGKIAGAGVHGAVRAISVPGTPPKFTASGTLFYLSGTLRYTLTGMTSAGPNGSVSLRASGRFTGGTGAYAGARGAFTGSGTKPANSFETFTFKGKVSYR